MGSVVRALVLWLVAGIASAAGLGDLEVESALGEPFLAEVRLSVERAQPNFDVRLGNPEEYARLNLPRPAIIESISPGAIRSDDRGWYVNLEGDQPVKELVLDLVLIIDRPGARQLRHYPVLLEVPGERLVEESVPVREPAPRQPQPDQRRRSTPVEPAPRADFVGSYTVVRGDTLYGIARRLAGPENMREAAQRLFELNPQAFARNDMNILLAGASLQLPADLAKPASGPQEEQPVATTTRAPETAAPPQPESEEPDRVELTVPPPPKQIEESLGRWENADEQTITEYRSEAARDLAFARAELETYRNENEQLQERVDLLEQRIADMQRLLELRERELAQAQEAEAATAAEGDSSTPIGAETSGGGVDSSVAPPAPEPETEAASEASAETEPESGWSLRGGAALYIGGALLAVLAVFIFYLHRREAAIRQQARRQLLDRADR